MTLVSPDIVITPVYEDEEASSRLFRELAASLGHDVTVVAVDDGSVRQPVSPDAIAAAGLKGFVLRLKRNVGHQRAIAVGIAYVAEHWPEAVCVVMDSDGEDVPDTVPLLLKGLGEGVDVCVARRKSRIETLRFKVFYVLYKVIFVLLTGRFIDFGNFMALRPAAIRRLAIMPELGTHIAGTVLLSRLRVAARPIDRGPRYAGRSKMNFPSLVLHGFRGLMVFAEDVLVRIGLVCLSVALVSMAAIVATVVLKTVGWATPGWFSVALGILFLVLLQTGTLTLITLMLTGVVRGSNPVTAEYKLLIDKVLETRG